MEEDEEKGLEMDGNYRISSLEPSPYFDKIFSCSSINLSKIILFNSKICFFSSINNKSN